MSKQKIKINRKFAERGGHLSHDENQELKSLILQDGKILQRLLLWSKTNELIDGHHRYEIARQHGLDYEVDLLDFDSEEEVLHWIDCHVVGQRNENPQARRVRIGRIYEYRKRQKDDSDANAEDENTADEVAEEVGVSSRSVQRASKISQQVDKLSSAIRKQYLSQELKLSDRVVDKLSRLPGSEQNKLARQVRVGEADGFEQALGLDKPAKPRLKPAATSKPAKKKDAVVKDRHGKAVPNKQLAQIFTDGRFAQMTQDAKQIRKTAKSIRGTAGSFLSLEEINSLVEALINELVRATPAYVCPNCEGKKCNWCTNAGFMPAYVYDQYQQQH